MEMPDLDGQPGWVVVVVFALFVLGGLGTLYLRRKMTRGHEPREVEAQSDTVAAITPAVGPIDATMFALNHMAESAKREADDADRAEKEARDLRNQLADCDRERAVLEQRFADLTAKLEECNRAHRRRNSQ